MSAAWNRIADGLETGVEPLLLVHVARVALYHPFVPLGGMPTRMRQTQG
ncbi:hypothetical protein [Aquicoccus sp.]